MFPRIPWLGHFVKHSFHRGPILPTALAVALLLLGAPQRASEASRGGDIPLPGSPPASSATVPGTTERVSVAWDGSQANGNSLALSTSTDGRFVAFRSGASNLVEGDTNGVYDVFVRDRQTLTTERVSVASDGSQANERSGEFGPRISADGRFVAFESLATNLVPGCGAWHIFVHDRQTGNTSCVSVASDGSPANNVSWGARISADGRFVAFTSWASNLVHGDTNGTHDSFIHDRETGTTTRVSVASDGSQNSHSSVVHSISADGRFPALFAEDGNLVPGDTNGVVDSFVHDRQTASTERISVPLDGSWGNGDSAIPAISGDGRFVAFESAASNMVPGCGTHQIFIRDRQMSTTSCVSVSSDGSPANNYSYASAISGDGRFVAFHSPATNLATNDTNVADDIFVHDRETGLTERVSVDSACNQANAWSRAPAIDVEGRLVAFESDASNLVPGDTNGYTDIFVHERGSCDSDGDGLLDSWEQNGLDVNGDTTVDLDFPRLGANRWRKDVFVEVDFMDCTVAGGDCGASDRHTHRPSADALPSVATAFDTAPVDPPPGAPPGTLGGVALHVLIDEAVPHKRIINWDNGFDAINSAHFGSAAERASPNSVNILAAKDLVYRYALFGHDWWEPGIEGYPSGIARDIPAQDFAVMLGSWAQGTGSAEEQAATFMHELGHTLGLGHGGSADDHVNCKPNYLSIMSYSRLHPWFVKDRPLDYSRQALPSLSELSLDEGMGIQGPAGQQTALGPPGTDGRPRIAVSDGQIDWDNDGLLEGQSLGTANVQANVNDLGFGGTGNPYGCQWPAADQTLAGHDDWTALQYAVPRDLSAAADRALNQAHTRDITYEERLEMLAVAPDHDADGVPTAQDNCPFTPNADQADNDFDGFAGSEPGSGDPFGGDACDPDDDNDAFGDDIETYVGTDPIDACPDNSSHDAWPPDTNVDTWADILDVLLFKPVIMTSVPPGPARFDLNADGKIDILDVLLYKPIIMTQCTNP